MTYVTKAASRGVPIDELEVAIQARVDLQGTFELDSVRAGLSDVTITVSVRSDVDDAVLDELARATRRTSAVYDTLANPVNIQLLVQRLPGNAAPPQDEAAVVTDI
jgi:hypothetical protein